MPAGSVFSLTMGETAQTAGPIRLFRIRYAWKGVTGRPHKASTCWGVRGDAKQALNDFVKRNPHVISCRVEKEVL